MGGSAPGLANTGAAAAGSLANPTSSGTGVGPLSTVAALASNLDITKQPLGGTTGSSLVGTSVGGRGKTAEVIAAIVKRTGLPPGKQVMAAEI